jgi:hypothetical protein
MTQHTQIPRFPPAPEVAPPLEALERSAGSGAQGARDDVMGFFHQAPQIRHPHAEARESPRFTQGSSRGAQIEWKKGDA